jgi:nitrogen regulatory protein PII
VEEIMDFKLIIAFINDEKTDDMIDAAKEAGATGATVISNARGEGVSKNNKTFFGLNLETQSDIVLLLVEKHLSREILETINQVAGFDSNEGSGIAFQIDVEDAVGLGSQLDILTERVEDKI